MPYARSASDPQRESNRYGDFSSSTLHDIGEEPDALTREAQKHEAFANIRRRTYSRRSDHFETLDRHVSGDGSPLLLFGNAGCGKTALLANWVAHRREKHPADFIVQHYVGGTHDSADHWRLIARVMNEIKRRSDTPDAVPTDHADMLRVFPIWLTKAKATAERDGARFILVIDALNRLDDRDHARLLGWLPERPFTGPLRLIVSASSDKPGPDGLPKAIQRRGWHKLHIHPLTVEERRRIISDHLIRFGKTFDEQPWGRLTSAPQTADPLYLKILLDELLIAGTHDYLDQRITGHLAAANVPALLQQFLTRCQRDYEHDSKDLVAEALGLICMARRGLSETELLQLLRPADQEQLSAHIWIPLRTALADSLENRDGILNIANDYFRAAVETAFAPDFDHRTALRLKLADYFEKQPITARTCDELPWLLWQAKEYGRLQDCLLNIDRFLKIHARDREELMRYWVCLNKKRTMGRDYLVAFEAWSHVLGRDVASILCAANDLAYFLRTASLHTVEEQLYRHTLIIWEGSQKTEYPVVARILNNLATLLKNANKLAEAEPLMRRALTINETNLGPVHPDVAMSLINLAQLLKETNRFAEAEPLMCRALAIDKTNLGPDHPKIAIDLNNLAQLLKETNRFAEAECLMYRALAIIETHFGPEHPDVASGLNSLAMLLRETNRFAEAESLMCRALSIDEICRGPEHPDVAKDLYNLAMLLKETNRRAEAEVLMRRAVAILETFHYNNGHEHPSCQNYKDNLRAMQISHPEPMGCVLQMILLLLAVWAFIEWCLL